MNKNALLCCAALFLFAFVDRAIAEDGYAGYYVSLAYDAKGEGKPVDNADGFPAKYIAHLQIADDGTYEALIFGALTSGKWSKMESRQGNEFLGMTIEKTVDKELEEKYGIGELSFMLARHSTVENAFNLMQLHSDEVMYLEKRDGELDVDAVLAEIQGYSEEQDEEDAEDAAGVLLAGDAVNYELLAPYLEAAGYSPEPPDGDGDIAVTQNDNQFTCYIRITGDSVWFWIRLRLKEDAPELQKLRFVNDINIRAPLLRGGLVGEGSVVAVDYLFWTDEGITVGQIMNSFDYYCTMTNRVLHGLNEEYDILD